MDAALEKFPLTSVIALAFVLVGGYLALTGEIDYGEYLTKTGIALAGLGVVGGTRVLDKWRKDGRADL